MNFILNEPTEGITQERRREEKRNRQNGIISPKCSPIKPTEERKHIVMPRNK